MSSDRRALEAIYRRYHQDLYRFCLAIVGNSQDAQDALQNTMVKVLRALPGEKRELKLKPWLYRIAHNESIEVLRRRRAAEPLDPELAGGGLELAEEAVLRERLRGLMVDLDELPERQRGALVMRELGGLDFDGIAAALGTSPAVARQTVYEARLGLREMEAGREMSCGAVTKAISDADGRVLRRRDVRAHLRACSECRRFREEIGARKSDLAGIAPLPAATAFGLLHGVLGGSGGSGGGGLAGALGGGAAKSLGGSAALKAVATVAVVAAVGTAAADRSGLIDAGSSTGSSHPASSQSSTAAESGSVSGAGASSATDASEGKGASGAVHGAKAASQKPGSAAGGSQTANDGSEGTAGAGGSHPHGQGHAKFHPAASAHGQATAGKHRASGAGHSHPSHPNHPAAPAHPVHPPKPAPPSRPAPEAPSAPSSAEPGSGEREAAAPKASEHAEQPAPDEPDGGE
jgi:RNA polymerase sigma factor (sigma-70 family)